MSIDYTWAQTLATRFRQRFSISALVGNHEQDFLEVLGGQTWRALHEKAIVNLLERGGPRRWPGRFVSGYWEPLTSNQPFTYECGKLFVEEVGNTVEAHLVLRPVLLMGTNIAKYDHFLGAPGTTTSLFNIPRLRVRHHPRAKLSDTDYRVSSLTSFGTRPGEQLVSFETEIRSMVPLAGHRQGEAVHEALCRILRESLGLATPTWAPMSTLLRHRAQARFDRGEVIEVQFDLSQGTSRPCLVISPRELNGHPFNTLLVLLTSETQSGDEHDDLLMPLQLHESAAPPFSIEFANVTCIPQNSALVTPHHSRIVLSTDSLREIDQRLEYFYA